jgi:L-amino acid N-acyltransferase YncA
MSYTIRPAEDEDIEHVHKIWQHYIENTDLGYEVTTPSLQEFMHRYYLVRAARLPYLVTLDGTKIVGWCFYRPFANSLDGAFKYTAVVESWVHPDHLDSTIGQLQKQELITRLRGLEIKEVLLVFNHTLEPFRTKMGMDFPEAQEMGKLDKLYEKHGQWMDLVICQFSSGNPITPKL